MAEKAYVSDLGRSPGNERRSTLMSGARRDRESRRVVPATGGSAGAARWVLQLQHQVGNQAVSRLLGSESGLQRRSITPPQAEAVRQPPASSGRSLDPATQSTMGNLLGHDFSKVRVHSGEAAANSARQLGARAYTVGDHIVLGETDPRSDSRSVRFSLGHELAHVVQQRLGGPPPEGGLDGPSEREAEAAAAALVDGRRPPSLVRGAAVGVQRQVAQSPAGSNKLDRARQIDDYVRAHPELSTVALQQLLNERNALLPLAEHPPAPAVRQPSTPPGAASGGSPSSPLELPDAIPLAAGMIIVPATSLASTVPPAVLFGTGAAGTGAAVGTTTAVGTGAAVETAVIGTGAALTTAAGASWVPIAGWIIAGLIVVGVVGFLVYRHYKTAPSPGLPERVEAPPRQPGSPISAPGQPGAPVSLPAHDTGRGAISLPAGSVSGPVWLPGQPRSSEPVLASELPTHRRDHTGPGARDRALQRARELASHEIVLGDLEELESAKIYGIPEEQGTVTYYRRRGSTAEMRGEMPWGNIVAIVEHTADPSQPPHFHVVKPPITGGKRIEHGGLYSEPFAGTDDQHLTYWLVGAPPARTP